MTPHEQMANDLEVCLEEYGYDAVLEALIDACQFWATAETTIHGCSQARWAQRTQALRQALRADLA